MIKKLNFYLYFLFSIIFIFNIIIPFKEKNYNFSDNIKTISVFKNENEEIISEFTTKFNCKNEPRSHNIKLSSTSIDQYIIQPGETFSYNNVVGPRDKNHGYKISKIFRDGEEIKGYGGGSCQVSTTLFNAAEKAGLKIIERHPHSKKIYYVGKDKDAAVSYGGIDLKFTNTFTFPVKINSYISNGSISIQIIKI